MIPWVCHVWEVKGLLKSPTKELWRGTDFAACTMKDKRCECSGRTYRHHDNKRQKWCKKEADKKLLLIRFSKSSPNQLASDGGL
jgi:hypothetical protein